MKGSIKTINDRGFGFIAPDDGGKDIFFHANDVEGVDFNALSQGDVVSFEMGDSDRGPKAIKITPEGASAGAGDDSAASDDDASDDTTSDDEAQEEEKTEEAA